jgi:hypothetical protein
MMAPDQEAFFRFFHTSKYDCIEESSYSFNICVTVEQGVNERISMKWALVVDGRARLVTTEVFFCFVRFFACV